jgi:hypothetical protein
MVEKGERFMDDLDPNALIERLKRAQGPDGELDRLIWAVARAGQEAQPEQSAEAQDAAYAFTGSLDAIYWLVSTRLPDWSGSVSFTRGVTIQSAGLWRSEPRANVVGTAATPALALCVAVVQALSAERGARGRASGEVEDAQEL